MNANNTKMLNRCLRDKKQAETRLAKIDKNWKQQKIRFQSLQDELNEIVINTKDFDLLNQQIKWKATVLPVISTLITTEL